MDNVTLSITLCSRSPYYTITLIYYDVSLGAWGYLGALEDSEGCFFFLRVTLVGAIVVARVLLLCCCAWLSCSRAYGRAAVFHFCHHVWIAIVRLLKVLREQ